MYAVARRYTGASALIDAITSRQQEVKDLIKGTPGFKAYYAVRSDDGGLMTVTVFDSREGAEATTVRVRDWVKQNLAAGAVGTPEVSGGEVVLNFS